ncbi:MAG: hypothetical protein GC200_01160 [Tepidisphaera sp.]|nr:hypothetical protein [Tepidisphaera sp.]
MKVLLDENIPHDLAGHEVFTVAYLGWHGVENGRLLAKAAEHGFDVVVTKDAGIEYEQNLRALPVSVAIPQAGSNSLEDLRPLVADLLKALLVLEPKSLVKIG